MSRQILSEKARLRKDAIIATKPPSHQRSFCATKHKPSQSAHISAQNTTLCLKKNSGNAKIHKNVAYIKEGLDTKLPKRHPNPNDASLWNPKTPPSQSFNISHQGPSKPRHPWPVISVIPATLKLRHPRPRSGIQCERQRMPLRHPTSSSVSGSECFCFRRQTPNI